ncbi:MAG: hypothetical protein L3K08_06635 [Thermoplasmata archaeon]|nr:hypothetical protein [Thermoplasmata archaeon]
MLPRAAARSSVSGVSNLPEWNLVSTTPLGIGSGAMAYDPAMNGTLLFGGIGGAANDYSVLNETWLLRNGSWENLTAGLPLSPTPRSGAAMTYDAADHEVVLFGGSHPGPAPVGLPIGLSDTWAFRSSRWVNLTTANASNPGARYDAGFAYDSGGGGAVLYGGESGLYGTLLNDTWEFRLGNWTNLTSTNLGQPPAAGGAGLAYDSAVGEVVLYGGWMKRSPFLDNETWEFGAGTWTNVTGKTGPGPRAAEVLVDDPADSELILYGGENTTALLNSTWAFRSGNWTELTSAVAPPARDLAVGAYDRNLSEVVLYGGDNAGYFNAVDNDLWFFSAGNWTEEDTNSTLPAIEHFSMTYDAHDREFVVFIANGTWVSPDGANWTRLPNPGGPGNLTSAAMAYDWADGYVVLFGGVNASGTVNDTWTFSAGNWTHRTTPTAPIGRTGESIAYDSAAGYVVLFGGYGFSDTWAFHAGRWTQLSAPGPSARAGAALTYDSADRELLLYGGDTRSGPVAASDTWTFSGGTWSNVTGGSALTPPGVFYGMAVNDSYSGATTLFGGFGAFLGCCHETWEYLAGNWTPESPPQWPVDRAQFGFTPGASGNASLLFGGEGGGLAVLADSWSYEGRPLAAIRSFSAAPTILTVGGSTRLSVSAVATRGVLSYRYVGLPGTCATANVTNLTCAPGAAGNYTIQVEATNATWGLNVSANLTLQVAGPLSAGPLAVRPSTVDAGQLVTITEIATGGFPPVVYGYAGLPASCASVDGPVVNCTTMTPGNYSITAYVNDSLGDHATARASLTVNPDLTAVLELGDPGAIDFGQTLAVTVVPSGGTAPVAVEFGGFPTGCPTTSNFTVMCVPQETGTFLLTANLSDATGTVVQTAVAVTVNPALRLVSLAARPTAPVAGQPLVLSTTVQGGTAPLTFQYTGLPSGCVPQNSSVITCSPSASGSFDPSVSVADSRGEHVSGSLPLTVAAAPSPLTAGATARPATLDVGQATAIAVVASGGISPYSFAYANLPAGCKTSNVTPLPCSPEASGSFDVRVTVTDARHVTTTAIAALDVLPQLKMTGFAPNQTSLGLGGAVELTTTVTGGDPPLAFSYSGLPSGCSSTNASSLTCTPTQVGSFNVTVAVSDGTGATAQANLTFTVVTSGWTSSTSPSGGSGLLWVGVLVAAAALVGVVVWYRQRAGRRNEGADPSEGRGETAAEPESPPPP